MIVELIKYTNYSLELYKEDTTYRIVIVPRTICIVIGKTGVLVTKVISPLHDGVAGPVELNRLTV